MGAIHEDGFGAVHARALVVGGSGRSRDDVGSVGAVQLIVMVLVFEFGCGSGVRTVGLRSLDSVEEPLWHRSYRGVCSLEVQLWQEGVLMAGCRIDSLLGGM